MDRAALFALRLVRDAAQRLGLEALLAPIDRAIAAATEARQLERRWAVQRTQGPGALGRELVEADNALDAELAAFDRLLAAEVNRWKRRDAERSARILAVRQLLFPLGVAKVLGAVYPEELAAVDDLRALCDAASPRRDAEAVRVVGELGLGADLAEVGRLADVLRELMGRVGPERLEFKAVQVARAAAQDTLAAVVVQVLAVTEAAGADGGAAAARRAELLRGIMEQDEAIRAYHQRSLQVPDVDPLTGGPVDEPLDDGAPLPAEG